MIFGGISIKGQIYIEIMEGKINSNRYQESLGKLIEKADEFHGKGKWTLQQDNCSCHTAAATKEYLINKSLRLVEHPPQSPDLNPIETIWGYLKRKVELNRPKNKEELKKYILTEWENIPLRIIRNIIMGIKRRMFIVKRNGGDNIKKYNGRKKNLVNYKEKTEKYKDKFLGMKRNSTEDEEYRYRILTTPSKKTMSHLQILYLKKVYKLL